MAELPEWSVTVRFMGDGVRTWRFPASSAQGVQSGDQSAMRSWEAAELRARTLRDQIVGALEEVDGPRVVRAVLR
jgi:hypothetical protein